MFFSIESKFIGDNFFYCFIYFCRNRFVWHVCLIIFGNVLYKTDFVRAHNVECFGTLNYTLKTFGYLFSPKGPIINVVTWQESKKEQTKWVQIQMSQSFDKNNAMHRILSLLRKLSE